MNVPRLDLAPKLERPLSLWKPLDYLRLLYWALFFPQAVRAYVTTFAREEPLNESVCRQRLTVFVPALRDHPVQRHLLVQALTITVGISLLLSFLILLTWLIVKESGVLIDWIGVVTGKLFVLMFGVAVITAIGTTFNMAFSRVKDIESVAAAGMVFLWVVGIALVTATGIRIGGEFVMVLGLVLSMATIVMLLVSVVPVSAHMYSGVADGVGIAVLSIVLSAVVGVLSGVVVSFSVGIIEVGIAFAMVLVMTVLPSSLGVGVWLVGLPSTLWLTQGRETLLPRSTLFPLPGLRHRLRAWLLADWQAGLHNVNQLLLYSLQFLPAIGAVNDVLDTLPVEDLFPAIAQLVQQPCDWDLVCFASAPLSQAMRAKIRDGLLFRVGRRSVDWKPFPRLDTSAHAAVAGFWCLHEKEPEKATEAFAVVRSLPYGEEMHCLACALAAAHGVGDMNAIAALAERPEFIAAGDALPPVEMRLHPTAWEALTHLQQAVLEVQTAQRGISRTIRTQALNRTLEELYLLERFKSVESRNEEIELLPIPEAERDLVQEIATHWREVLLGVLLTVEGEITPLFPSTQRRQPRPVINPYVVGGPVVGRGFVGREDILRRLEELWAGSQAPPSVVLFGHRRMGKTSILRNLHGHLGASIHLAYVNLLLLGEAPGAAGDVLRALADSIAQALEAARQSAPVVDLAAFQIHPYRAFEQYLRAVQEALGKDRLILTVDEFEQLEYWMDAGRLPRDFLKVLRGYIQLDPHIAFAFAGSHTLEEMTADYFEPFFASVIAKKVGFLGQGAVFQLLANPVDDFPLDYMPEALERVWQLTAGQPYLVQLAGHRLVSRFNDLTFERGQRPEPRFAAADVEAMVDDPEFYQMGRYYFTGVWGQAGRNPPGQHAVLRTLARLEARMPAEEIACQARLAPEEVRRALETLKRHDVVTEADGRWQFTVELMRRWVAQR